VEPSPLNAVKLDLAVIAVVGLMTVVVLHIVGGSLWVQVGILFAYGLIGMTWLLLRTHRVLKQNSASRDATDES
jgi:Flp pilus assembly protein TadB